VDFGAAGMLAESFFDCPRRVLSGWVVISIVINETWLLNLRHEFAGSVQKGL
jgi:hypothetical protein